ncbi:MAG: hypothetical protein LBD58_07260, partial [Treponema sp.]|nr:hypothetical protein [Treponema sp.]
MTVRLVFPDKTTHDYEVDALKVLDQSLEALDWRGMALLFPFCLLKFRKEAGKAGATGEAEGIGWRDEGDVARDGEVFDGRGEGWEVERGRR